MLTLGHFGLVRPLARGGMGEVWRARHLPAGAEGPLGANVAIKVLLDQHARDPEVARDFEREVRAASALDHPNIATMLDRGRVPEAAARLSEGALVADSPWYAMELAAGGTLASWVSQPPPWPTLRGALLRLLDALGHAHARGIVHRDIKPANVLLGEGRDVAERLRLVDFGIAAARREPASLDDRLVGTPLYMSPEQFDPDLGRVGPWTDLFALGVMCWMFLQGTPPWTREELRDRPTERIDPAGWGPPRVNAPARVEGWVRQLIALESGRRYRFAADAARALSELDAVRQVWSLDDLDGLTWDERQARPAQATTPTPATRPPLPAQPPPERGSGRPGWLRDAGLGLTGLRALPLLGRDRELVQLWGALRQTVDGARLGVALVHGAAGCGKTRLIEGLLWRAHELGAAEHLRISAREAGTDGLALLARAACRCEDAEPVDAPARVRQWTLSIGLGEQDLTEVVLALAWPGAETGALRIVQLETLAERHAALAHVLSLACLDRPLIVHVEAAHEQEGLLAFAAWVLQAPIARRTPALLVLELADELLAERPVAAELVGDLRGRVGVLEVALGPLDRAVWPGLMAALLPLSAPSARHVAERAAGNPLFAAELVAELVARGQVVPGAEGLTLRGADAPLPGTLAAAWRERVARLLADRDDREALALAAAAALGVEVDAIEWDLVCDRLGAWRPEHLLRELLDRRLALQRPGAHDAGWRFAHAALREAVLDWATSHGLRGAIHEACAVVLQAQQTLEGRARAGRHLLAAGQRRLGTALLLDVTLQHVRRADVARAEATLAEIGDPPRDELPPRLVAELDYNQGWAHLVRGRVAAAETALLASLRTAESNGLDALVGHCLHRMFRLKKERGDADTDAWLQRAREHAESSGDRTLLATCLLERTRRPSFEGDVDQTLAELDRIRALATDPSMGTLLTRVIHFKARVCVDHRRLDEADRLLNEGEAVARAHGLVYRSGWLANLRGEVARARGDLEAARACYQLAARTLRPLGLIEGLIVPAINVALTELAAGDPRACLGVVDELLARLDGRLIPTLEAAARGTRIQALIQLDRWPEVDVELRRLDLLPETAAIEREVVTLLTGAGDTAAGRDEPGRARDLWSLALRIASGGRFQDLCEALRTRLGGPGAPIGLASP